MVNWQEQWLKPLLPKAICKSICLKCIQTCRLTCQICKGIFKKPLVSLFRKWTFENLLIPDHNKKFGNFQCWNGFCDLVASSATPVREIPQSTSVPIQFLHQQDKDSIHASQMCQFHNSGNKWTEINKKKTPINMLDVSVWKNTRFPWAFSWNFKMES